MTSFLFSTLKGKLITWFIIIAAAPVIVVGYLAFVNAKYAIQSSEHDKLQASVNLRRNEVASYIYRSVQMIKFLASTETVTSDVETLDSYHQYGKLSPEAAYDVNTPLYERMRASIESFYSMFLLTHEAKITGFQDILLLNAKDGHVMYTVRRLSDLGSNVVTGRLKDSGLAETWRKVIKTKRIVIEGFSPYEPSASDSAFLGAPVVSKEGNIIGVIVLRIGSNALDSIMGGGDLMTSEVEAFMVNEKQRVIAHVHRENRGSHRGAEAQDTLNKDIKHNEGENRQKFDHNNPNKDGRENSRKEATMILGGSHIEINRTGQRSYIHPNTNKKMLVAYSSVELDQLPKVIKDFNWVVIAHVPESLIMAPVVSIGYRVALTGLVITALASLVAFLLASAIARPITELAEKAAVVSAGDLTVESVGENRNDEVGALALAFHQMIKSLREQTGSVLEGVNILATSTGEISVTMSQLSATASRTSSAATQTITTVEQVKQAARVSGDKAQMVSESSQEVVSVAKQGLEATEGALKGISRIKDQINEIGETVEGLAEKSQAVEEIIAVVKDLADQSNLLAVNASIEAARAGEHGKEFNVVAQEIKTLSDQSKDATVQIRSILDQIRNSINDVVKGTRESSKTVEDGVNQAIRAGEAIQTLAASVDEAAQAASIIGASSEQQFAGIDQVSDAMANLEDAAKQNALGALQVESEAKKLEDLGKNLKDLVGRYKV